MQCFITSQHLKTIYLCYNKAILLWIFTFKMKDERDFYIFLFTLYYLVDGYEKLSTLQIRICKKPRFNNIRTLLVYYEVDNKTQWLKTYRIKTIKHYKILLGNFSWNNRKILFIANNSQSSNLKPIELLSVSLTSCKWALWWRSNSKIKNTLQEATC